CNAANCYRHLRCSLPADHPFFPIWRGAPIDQDGVAGLQRRPRNLGDSIKRRSRLDLINRRICRNRERQNKDKEPKIFHYLPLFLEKDSEGKCGGSNSNLSISM